MGVLGKFMMNKNNVKAFLRYRWMVNYLAVPMMVDRHTAGLRGNHLRIAHTEYDLVVEDIAKLMQNMFRADKNIGKDEELSKKIVILDENEMSHLLCGFPNLIGLGREIPAVYVSVLLQQVLCVRTSMWHRNTACPVMSVRCRKQKPAYRLRMISRYLEHAQSSVIPPATAA